MLQGFKMSSLQDKLAEQAKNQQQEENEEEENEEKENVKIKGKKRGYHRKHKGRE